MLTISASTLQFPQHPSSVFQLCFSSNRQFCCISGSQSVEPDYAAKFLIAGEAQLNALLRCWTALTVWLTDIIWVIKLCLLCWSNFGAADFIIHMSRNLRAVLADSLPPCFRAIYAQQQSRLLVKHVEQSNITALHLCPHLKPSHVTKHKNCV